MSMPNEVTNHPHLGPPIALRTRDVADLTVAAGYPCISVLMPTEPAPRMTPADFDRLHQLITLVDRILRTQDVVSPGRLMGKLSDEVRKVTSQPTDRGVAIYVSLAISRSFRLPQAVQERAVVERTFATRPLVAALHRMPPHAVLVLHPTCAHLFAGADGGLHPVEQYDPFGGGAQVRLPSPDAPDAAQARADLSEAYLRAVDRMLAAYRAEHPSPLVLAGSPRLLDRFCALSHNLDRLAGRVDPEHGETALDLALACTTIVDEYLRSRRDDALEQLDRAVRARPSDVVSGIEDCWRNLHTEPPGMLLVEESFISPGLTVTGLARETRPVTTEEVHDLVDDLIEQVIVRGGQLALVRDGDLRPYGRIALISRPQS